MIVTDLNKETNYIFENDALTGYHYILIDNEEIKVIFELDLTIEPGVDPEDLPLEITQSSFVILQYDPEKDFSEEKENIIKNIITDTMFNKWTEIQSV